MEYYCKIVKSFLFQLYFCYIKLKIKVELQKLGEFITFNIVNSSLKILDTPKDSKVKDSNKEYTFTLLEL